MHRAERQQRRASIGDRRIGDRLAGGQAVSHAGAHQTGENRNDQPLLQREFLDCGFLFLLGQSLVTQRSGIADYRDTSQRDSHTDQHRPTAGSGKEVLPGHDRRNHRTECGAESGRDRLSERNTQIAHAEAPGKTADAPQRTEQDGQEHGFSRSGRQYRSQCGKRYGIKCEGPRQDDPRHDALANPVSLPRPVFNLVDGSVIARPGKRPDGHQQDSDK